MVNPAQARRFVLIHGAGHGGWLWRRVRDRLAAKGHLVLTPTLTGLGERSHLLDASITLETHITDVVNVFKWEDLTDAVLVGHSYAGWVVSVRWSSWRAAYRRWSIWTRSCQMMANAAWTF
jgi:pimeloyl-ACP methyl ester carboxylesterase